MNLPDFTKGRVLVVGDLLLDRYWRGDTSRVSPEAPVPVVHVQKVDERPGGSGNVAINATALGGTASIISVVGDDLEASILERMLHEKSVHCHFYVDSELPTVTKLRVLSRHQQLLRLDFEKYFENFDKEGFIEQYKLALKEHDVVVISDYGKGTLFDIQRLIALANEAGVATFVDPKQDFVHYAGATLITPNLKEFEAIVGPCPNDETLVTKGQSALKQYDLTHLLVTRGQHGMTLFSRDEDPTHLPTHALDVFDVTGAGDTVIGVLALAYAVKMPMIEAMQLANYAAGVVVGKVGTATATVQEIRERMLGSSSSLVCVIDEDELVDVLAETRSMGKRIVMTNGCFDILHTGHITYLEEAKALGDKLIVAVNTDESVRGLKGPERPINNVDARMRVLAGLGCVDWVVSFSEETPKRLINRIIPDVLVKGGDWKAEEIVGSDTVLQHGGSVQSLPFVKGFSTTSIIEKMKE